MTSDDRGSDADSGGVADKDDLQRAVEERVAAVEAAAGSEPVVNAPKQEQTAGTGATTSPTERVTPEKSTADSPVTANPVVAPAPIAEPGDAAGAPAPQPGPPSHDPTRPNTPRVTDEGDE
ncbi:MAG: 1,4-alpha-glucan (glycogen) branching enzyme, GH-13-type [uncultured Thermomicrobiales bacterium]|uniref:1,4-alpha-glucan (Glycogen) branching enzyme, GH-13-type n=1 Tax=uncultured Thermomicrobiales bacterium TaxID=1645740 RepID=A0A6J4U4Z3_9BACT|nr:MAG: 1,4-alpha-glucan (glycogen) branching enzyme, GH-13-type [uncultured Thermomicrobiales bacterium]